MYILSVALFALDYSVSVTPNQGMVGDIFKYELIVTYTESESLISVPDTSLFQAFSIQDKAFKKEAKDGLKTLTFSVDFQAFSIDEIVVPTQTITYKTTQVKKIIIPPIFIPIQSLMSTENKGVEPDPLKPLPTMSLGKNAWLKIGGFCVVVLGLIFGLWKLLKKKSDVFGDMKDIVEIDERSPQEKAMEALTKLPTKGYIQAKLYKAFYTELCEILKLFLSEELTINGVDMTTEELMDEINTVVDEQTLRRLKHILSFSDLVKFAKFDASDSPHDDYIEKAKEVISRITLNEI